MLPNSVLLFPLPFLLTAILFGVMTACTSVGSAKAQLRLIATSLLGATFLIFGGVMAVEIAQAPRVYVEGTVEGLRHIYGKHSHSEFNVEGNGVQQTPLSMDYRGSNLVDGERVRVTYVRGFGTVTSFAVLDGDYAGWTRTEGDGTVICVVADLLGVIVIFSALSTKLRYPDGNVPSRRGRLL